MLIIFVVQVKIQELNKWAKARYCSCFLCINVHQLLRASCPPASHHYVCCIVVLCCVVLMCHRFLLVFSVIPCCFLSCALSLSFNSLYFERQLGLDLSLFVDMILNICNETFIIRFTVLSCRHRKELFKSAALNSIQGQRQTVQNVTSSIQ